MKTKILIPLMAGLALLCACKGKNAANTADTIDNTNNTVLKKTGSKSDTVQSSAKLIKTANIRFKVKNVQQTCERVAALTAGYNGSVINQVVGSTPLDSLNIRVSDDSTMRVTTYNTAAQMTVKIPPAKLEDYKPGCTVGNLYQQS